MLFPRKQSMHCSDSQNLIASSLYYRLLQRFSHAYYSFSYVDHLHRHPLPVMARPSTIFETIIPTLAWQSSNALSSSASYSDPRTSSLTRSTDSPRLSKTSSHWPLSTFAGVYDSVRHEICFYQLHGPIKHIRQHTIPVSLGVFALLGMIQQKVHIPNCVSSGVSKLSFTSICAYSTLCFRASEISSVCRVRV
jgi:hypothetical protein